MAPRPSWQGYLRLSLVTCPVAMLPAASEAEKVRFHTLDRATGNRVHACYVDAKTGKPVDDEDQVKGYEREDSKYVMQEDEELQAVALESARTIDIGAASDVASAFAAMHQNQRAARRRVSRGRGSRIVPAIVFHGDQDTTVHPHNDDHVIAQLREALNIDLQTTVQKGRVPGGRGYSRILHRDPGGQAIFEQWVIHGAGYAWSGGSPSGSYTDPQGPDATREMLRFFLDHPQL
jgi:hypothetical protein